MMCEECVVWVCVECGVCMCACVVVVYGIPVVWVCVVCGMRYVWCHRW